VAACARTLLRGAPHGTLAAWRRDHYLTININASAYALDTVASYLVGFYVRQRGTEDSPYSGPLTLHLGGWQVATPGRKYSGRERRRADATRTAASPSTTSTTTPISLILPATLLRLAAHTAAAFAHCDFTHACDFDAVPTTYAHAARGGSPLA